MVHLGFSYIGVLWLIMLFVPNAFWAKNKPADYDKYVNNENKILLMLERTGEVLCSALCLIFSDFNIRRFTIWSLWLIASFVLMVLYELYWVRYFRSGKTMADMYSSYAGFPVAGATLPCIAFLFLGIYGTNSFMIIAALILSVGHIGIHLMHRKEVVPGKPVGRLKKVLRVIAAIPVVLILLITFVAIAGRNINWFRNYIDTSKGVNEAVYLEIGGQEQYMLIRGRDTSNTVILYLHGGPGSPDACVSYLFTDYLIDDYTVVSWEQRGCGRTYFRNAASDPDNLTVDFDQAINDTDQIVDMLRERFNTDKIIIVGHSYGSLLGSRYAQMHSDKVSAFVGIGQFVNLAESDEYAYEDALNVIEERGEDPTALEAAYADYMKDSGNLQALVDFRSVHTPYHPASVEANTIVAAFFSPYTGVDDLRWLLKQTDLDSYLKLNSELMGVTASYDLRGEDEDYDIPMFFISGDRDFICNYVLSEEYCDEITAPYKEYAVIPGCGHAPQFASPEEFASVLKGMLDKAA